MGMKVYNAKRNNFIFEQDVIVDCHKIYFLLWLLQQTCCLLWGMMYTICKYVQWCGLKRMLIIGEERLFCLVKMVISFCDSQNFPVSNVELSQNLKQQESNYWDVSMFEIGQRRDIVYVGFKPNIADCLHTTPM